MSDKDRNKKDHTRTDKKNKAMHERENPRPQKANRATRRAPNQT